MKLHEIKPLLENTNDYIVYKVSSPETDFVYYGYTKHPDIKKGFLSGGGREAEPDRGDVRMMNAGGGEENLRFSMEDIFVDELDAWMTRNDLRSQDSNSITGPTNWPTPMLRAAKDKDPERVAKWKLNRDLNNMTARDAMASGAFTFADLKSVVGTDARLKADVTKDLDRMLYPAFKIKYGV